jgi:hypothetical protein
MRHIPESRSFTMNFIRESLRTRREREVRTTAVAANFGQKESLSVCVAQLLTSPSVCHEVDAVTVSKQATATSSDKRGEDDSLLGYITV